MLPIYRLIPVGGVFLAIAILLLALNPPRATSPSARAALQPARGALIDRAEHPEWRQFLIRAALRRAGEVQRLRDLRDTVIRSETPAATSPVVEAKPDVTEAPLVEAEPATAHASTAEIRPDIAEASPADLVPEIAEAAPSPSEPKAAKAVTARSKAGAAEPEFTEIVPEAPEPNVAATTTIEVLPNAAEPVLVTAGPKITDETVKAESDVAEPKVSNTAPTVEANLGAAKPKVAVEPGAIASEAEPIAAERETAEAAPLDVEPETVEPKVGDSAPVIAAKPESTEPESVASAPEAAASQPEPVAAGPKIAAAPVEAEPETTEPKAADAAPVIAARPDAAQSKPAVTPEAAASEPELIATEPKMASGASIMLSGVAPAPMAIKPETGTPTRIASIAPALPLTGMPVTAPLPPGDDVAAPGSPLETNGSRIRADAAPLPIERKVAALPVQPTESNSVNVTGSIEPTDRTATIPVGIGEASSTELLVTLPRERPPVLRQLQLRRARESKVKQPRRPVHHVSRAKKKRRQETVPPEFAFFALLIKAFDPDAKFDPNARFAPIKPTIPYQPNDSWRKQ